MSKRIKTKLNKYQDYFRSKYFYEKYKLRKVMSENKFSRDNYSLQELYEVMESIDDLSYPDRALDIYTLLLNLSLIHI